MNKLYFFSRLSTAFLPRTNIVKTNGYLISAVKWNLKTYSTQLTGTSSTNHVFSNTLMVLSNHQVVRTYGSSKKSKGHSDVNQSLFCTEQNIFNDIIQKEYQQKYAKKEDEDDEEEAEEENDNDDDDENLYAKVIKSIDVSDFKPGLKKNKEDFFKFKLKLEKLKCLIFKGFKISVKTIPSLRLDSVLSSGLNYSRK